MSLFTVGPVSMYPRTLEIDSRQVPYFRTSEFSQLVLENEALVKKMTFADEQSRLVFLTASGTGAMEATVMNCFSTRDKVLVIDGGSFGHRFVEICEIHGVPFEALHLRFGDELTEEMLAPFEGRGFTGLLVNIHETSVGHLYDGKMLSNFCHRNDLLFVVDAISSFLADPLDMTELGVDALIFSSQKALALAPGLAVVVVSQRMYEDHVRGKASESMYFDFESHIVNGARGQTPFTPAVRVLIELNDMLKFVEETGGVAAKVASTRRRAEAFRESVENLPVRLPTYRLSNAVTPLILDGIDARGVFETLRNSYNITVNPNGGDLSSKLLRVGHIGNQSEDEYRSLAGALDEILGGTK